MNFDLINKIYSNGIDTNTYVYLKAIEQSEFLLIKQYFKDFDTVCQVKGLLYPGTNRLTPKAIELLKKVEKSDKIVDYQGIHKALQAQLLYKMGKKQIQGFGGVYFIPSVKELEQFLVRFWKDYPKYTDIVKIQKILLNHLNNCCKTGKFAPSLKYFIIKDGSGSPLGAVYDSFDDKDDKDIIVEPKPIKNLF